MEFNLRLFRGFALLIAIIASASVGGFQASAQAPGAIAGGTGFFQGNSFDFGAPGGFLSGLQNGGTTNIFEVDINGGGGSDFLGCAGLDIFSFFDVTFNLNNVIENFGNYLKTKLVKELLIKAFSSPQLASIFDTLQAFGNARLDMFNETCSIDEIKSEAKDLFVKKCVEEYVTTKGRSVDQAITECTQNYDSESRSMLTKFADEFVEKMKQSGNVGNLIRPLCAGQVGGPPVGSPPPSQAKLMACDIMAFLPQFRLCYSAGTSDSSTSECKTSGSAARNSPLPSSKVFTAINTVSFQAFQAIGNGVGKVTNTISQAGAVAAANAYTAAVKANGGLLGDVIGLFAENTPTTEPATRLALFNYDLTPTYFGNAEGGGDDVESNIQKEFRDFLHCTITDPFAVANDFIGFVNQREGLSIDVLNLDDEGKVPVSELINIDSLGPLSNQMKVDALGAAKLLDMAMGCIYNHFLHFDVGTIITLQSLAPADREAYFKAASNRAAYLGTELILRFLKQKVLEAHVALSGEVLSKATAPSGSDTVQKEADENPIPPQALEAIKVMAEIFENQIQALRAVREERDSFSAMSQIVYDKARALRIDIF